MDAIKLAKLIAFIQIGRPVLIEGNEIGRIMEMIEDINPPQPTAAEIVASDDFITPWKDKYADHIDAILRCLRDGKKIEAIKEYRSATGRGLKESKDAIEIVSDKIRDLEIEVNRMIVGPRGGY